MTLPTTAEPAVAPDRVPGWRRLLPEWGRTYDRPTVRADILAGLTVAVLLVPQAMAYATLAGLPPVVGLYAATLPIVVYALLGSSAQLAVGPVAIVALLTGTAIAPHAGSAGEAVTLAAVLAVLVGAVQLAIAVLRLSWIVKVLTHAVIVGFTSAAAILIALSQIRDLLGVEAPGGDTAVAVLTAVVARLSQAHPMSFLIGAGAVGLLLVLRRVAPRFPGPLLLLVGGAFLSAVFGMAGRGVDVIGTIPPGLPAPSLPAFDVATLAAMLPAAVAIALIGYAEGWSVARAVARHSPRKPRAARELVAVGGANVAAGLVSGMPVAGGFSRTAVNLEAGARTPAAGLVTAAVIALVVAVATPLLEPLPRAVLAAVIVVAVLRLVDLREILRLVRMHPAEGAAAVTTFAATLLVGVEPGLGIGIVAGLGAAWWKRRRSMAAQR